MNKYSIKDLEQFTGIKAHTLRIWEQRFNLFTPSRTDTNIRYYSNDDVRKALNINLLYSNGWKISKIASLTDDELISEVSKIAENTQCEEDTADVFIRYILEFNENATKDLLLKLTLDSNLLQVYADSLIPLLTKIGDLWQAGSLSVAHEHFFSNILRDFILSRTALLEQPAPNAKKVVLFLHEQEIHELGLLMMHHGLRKNGLECFYLGAKVPLSDLKKCVNQIQPDYLVTSFIASLDKEKFVRVINEIALFFDLSNLHIGGFQVRVLDKHIPKKVNKLLDIQDINKIV